MVVRKRRAKNGLRGKRTHGWGNTKRHRGSGSRGGVGKAGGHKHKFSKMYVNFGVKITLKPKKKGKVVSLWKINQMLPKWIAEGKVKKEGSKIIVDGRDLGIEKIIGPGKADKNVVFENVKLSKKLGGGEPGEDGEVKEDN